MPTLRWVLQLLFHPTTPVQRILCCLAYTDVVYHALTTHDSTAIIFGSAVIGAHLGRLFDA